MSLSRAVVRARWAVAACLVAVLGMAASPLIAQVFQPAVPVVTPASVAFVGGSATFPGGATLNGALMLGTSTFATLGTTFTANGQLLYCSDCTIANPCAGSGTGALAKRLNGTNICN